jgi:hypothetical protein
MIGQPRILKVMPLIAVSLCAIAAGGDNPAHKLDDGLAGDGFHPIFVRMEDQLLKKAADYDTFCRENESAKRSIVRQSVTKTLRTNADATWERVKDRVAQLEAAGLIKDTTRFWIVNGFACDATAAACNALADDPNVSFVYLQRGPPHIRQHRKAPAPIEAQAAADKTIDDLPPEQRARVLARLKDQGIDPAQVRIRLAGPSPAPNAEDQKSALERLLKDFRSDADEPFNAKGLEIPWNLRLIQADQVWEQEGVVGKGAVVALNDSGIIDIPALRPALWRNAAEKLNDKDDEQNGYVDDLFGYNFAHRTGYVHDDGNIPHGTICACIVAGRPVPDKPFVSGVAPRARIMPLNGMGYLKAYEYALANGADVLSMSYMWPHMELGQYRGLFRTAAEHLSAGGVMSVGGAGNFAKSAPAGKQICLPKDIPCVMAVGGVIEDAKPFEPSSKGPCSWGGIRFYDDFPTAKPLRKPDICAPAGGFPCWVKTATRPPEWKEIWKGKESEALVSGPRGNSFAGPHAAGVAALVFSANPELNAWQVKRIIEDTSRDLGDPGPDNQFGAGLLQALDAVRQARRIPKS